MPVSLPLDRLVRKEVALGVIREILPPQNHIGLDLVPWMDVESDDVVFDYLTGMGDGLAPAISEDGEAELAQKDDLWAGQGRASVIDWRLKDQYKASDVSRYREALAIVEQLAQTGTISLVGTQNILDGFQQKIARDQALRRRKLDNRIEWLIMTAIE